MKAREDPPHTHRYTVRKEDDLMFTLEWVYTSQGKNRGRCRFSDNWESSPQDPRTKMEKLEYTGTDISN